MDGKITRVVVDRGFGFIQVGKEDFFFHQTDLTNCDIHNLAPGETVTFEADDTPKGKRARAVTRGRQ